MLLLFIVFDLFKFRKGKIFLLEKLKNHTLESNLIHILSFFFTLSFLVEVSPSPITSHHSTFLAVTGGIKGKVAEKINILDFNGHL